MGMIAHPGNCFAYSAPYVYQNLQISRRRRRRPGKTEAIEYWLWLKMNGFMSTLLDPQEYCLQGCYSYELYVFSAHTAWTAKRDELALAGFTINRNLPG